ncbi:hypothetical protein NA57DRAFT_56910 [Rhizodiscina lignyota]|uniref:Uncharacterized protein n=1 Tax=Rhizodiscina lignyota TaxID=1504668 RepID=A0A9P4M571_9PEZI|nr:hypothetical protein NA57DRAFT_56910 [Rhizodiscina lignyota]
MSSLLHTAASSLRTPRLMATAAFHPRSSYRLRSTCPPGTRIASIRQQSQEQRCFHAGTKYAYAQKDTQDKDTLKPRSTQYSQSEGGDDAAATESAFDPSTSSPEESSKKVEKESGSNAGEPMEVSPGNPDVSKRKPEENQATAKSSREAGEGSDRSATSGRGSPNKASGDKSG